MHLV
jgi:nuclear cap-binding protein subunit 1